jgi:hypothetical protein
MKPGMLLPSEFPKDDEVREPSARSASRRGQAESRAAQGSRPASEVARDIPTPEARNRAAGPTSTTPPDSELSPDVAPTALVGMVNSRRGTDHCVRTPPRIGHQRCGLMLRRRPRVHRGTASRCTISASMPGVSAGRLRAPPAGLSTAWAGGKRLGARLDRPHGVRESSHGDAAVADADGDAL